ncbi:MAG: DegT/DnrJ/EryC1/StrS family aminotransferase [Chloroflexi bacterium]|nr:DegT/DnrJ/EryC1/StrS family aminotransferase [Chloroflexota bacterium]
MIPVCEPLIGTEELQNVADAITRNEISGSFGKYIDEFETKFSQYCDARYGIATTSGTTALHLALASIGVKQGDEVIVSTFTNIATANAVCYCGARPVAVDSEPETWNIDVAQIEKKITPRTKAILPVHIYGHPCDIDPILQLAAKHGLCVVEDAAEAHGAEYKGRKVGSLGDVACFSFYANKIITTGEGGMVVTNDPAVADKARLLRNLAFSKKRRFEHHYLGFNYRMTNIQAAVGVAQLRRIEEFIDKKRHLASLYSASLRDVPGITLPVEKPWAKNVYWMYSIVVGDKYGLSRDELVTRLAENGIETRTMFIPMNQQPVFHQMGLFNGESCPVAEDLSRRGLYLPSGVGLTDEQIEFVCDAVRRLAKS